MLNNRLEWIDNAKGIGICLVVVGHCLKGLLSAGLIPETSNTTLLWNIIYSFHMPLFFFLAGLFVTNSLQRAGRRQLILSKIDSVLYPYLLWSLLQGSLEIGMSEYTNRNTSWQDVLSLFWQPYAQFWFLYELFLFFCLAAITVFNRMLSLLTLTAALSLYLLQHWGDSYAAIRFFKVNWLFFVVGTLIGQYRDKLQFSIKQTLLLVMLFIAIEYVFHIVFDDNYLNKTWYSLGTALLGIATVCAVAQQLHCCILHQIFNRLGQVSLAIYVMHIIIIAGTRITLQKVLTIESAAIYWAVCLTNGLLLPLLVIHIAERLQIRYLLQAPLSRWLKLRAT